MRITLKVLIAALGILTTGCLPMQEGYQASSAGVGKPTDDTRKAPVTAPVVAPPQAPQPLANICKTKDMALLARYKMSVEGVPQPSIPYPPAENNTGIMIPYQSKVMDLIALQYRHYLHARYITSIGPSDLVIEKTITPFHTRSQNRQILSLKGYENKFLAVTGPNGGNLHGHNPPIRIFAMNNVLNNFELLAEVNVLDSYVRSAHLDVSGQYGILMLQSENYYEMRLNFYKLDLVSKTVAEIKSLETKFQSTRIYTKFLKLNVTGFTLGIHEEIFVTTSTGGYFRHKFHILRSENSSTFLHEEPFQVSGYRDIALTMNNQGQVYKLSNEHNYTRDQQGYLFIDSTVVAERYDGTYIVPVEIKFAPFQYKSSGFAAQNLLTENNDLYILARTYDDGNDLVADYKLLKTNDDGATYNEQSIVKDNTSALLYHMARTQGSTFVIGNDQQTSETLIYCSQ